jgi:U3 small nucleolar RNA-associated protein MPP10
MESALPPTSAASTLLAPEELFAPPTASSLVSRAELTPEEAQRARQKSRKARQTQKRKLGDMAELYGKKNRGAKAEKEAALKGLVKAGKGVTVVGKGEKETGKVRRREGESGEREDGKRLKL